jgi:DNA-binding response OmpR family regulator
VKDQSRVLIVDDQDFERALLSELVSDLGCEPRGLSSGVKIADVIEEFLPDLILLDLGLPDLPGDKVIQEIRARHSSSDLPVIVISGKSKSADIIELLKLGANDYITKPFEFEVCLARIELHLKLSLQQKKIGEFKEREVIGSMVTTYNHEINNPLAIALAGLELLKKNPNDLQRLETIRDALLRIANITEKIRNLVSDGTIVSEPYVSGETKLYKVR